MQQQRRDPLKEAQKVMLDMMLAIHRICEQNGIRYWITDGTLLGAIRHKGFIPWDDDADLAMLREDYDRFAKIVANQLPKPYVIETEEVNTHGKHNWLKVLYLDDFEWVDWHGITRKGISIDIFPFDYAQAAPAKTKTEKLVNRIATIDYPAEANNVKNKLRRVVNRAKVHNWYVALAKKSPYVTYGIETRFFGWAYFKETDIFPLQKGTFEGHEFYIPHNYDAYLTLLYNDYMKIPDESEQQAHMSQLTLSQE